MVFQDPFSAFNPVHRISHGIMRNLALHRPELSHAERRREAERVCESRRIDHADARHASRTR